MVVINIPTEIKVPYEKRNYAFKVTYTKEGPETDISTDLISINQLERRDLKDGIGAFSITLHNPEGKFNSIMEQGVVIKVYQDYNTATVTTQIGYGKVDNSLHSLTFDNAFLMTIVGRDYPELEGERFSLSLVSATGKSSMQSVVSQKFSSLLTTNNIPDSMNFTVDEEFIDSKGINMFQGILKKGLYSGYIDFTNDIHTFPSGSLTNTTESLLYGVNLLGFSNVGNDNLNSINKVKVKGATKSEIDLFITKEDTDLQDLSWIKTDVISRGDITTLDALESAADTYLAYNKQSPTKGVLIAINGMPALNPGESFFLSCQYANLSGYYVAASINHQYTNGLFVTVIEISRLTRPIIDEIQLLEEQQNKQNANLMEDTVFYVNPDNTGDMASGSFTSGKIVIASGSQRTISTINKVLDYTPSKFSFQVKGTHLNISYIRFSLDNGITFNANTTYNLEEFKNQEITLDITGENAYTEIVLNSDATYTNPQLEAFGIFTKR